MAKRVLYLFDEVEKNTMKPVIEKIIEYNNEDDEKDKKEKDFKREPIELIINCNGGVMYDGFGLIDVIDKSTTAIHTYVHGLAASMGLLIATSGHKRFSGKNSTFMYHSASGGRWGSLEYLKTRLDEVQRLQDIYDNYLLLKTKMKKEFLLDFQEKSKDYFFSAEQALELGVIDQIV